MGVAPPAQGRHFYTDPGDKLARGLFGVLTDLGCPGGRVAEFRDRGFFLTQTAKCAIRGTPYPWKSMACFCAGEYLEREIDILAPRAVCFLSRTVGYPVALSALAQMESDLPFGRPVPLETGRKQRWVLATFWPGRGKPKTARSHLDDLFAALGG